MIKGRLEDFQKHPISWIHADQLGDVSVDHEVEQGGLVAKEKLLQQKTINYNDDDNDDDNNDDHIDYDNVDK